MVFWDVDKAGEPYNDLLREEHRIRSLTITMEKSEPAQTTRPASEAFSVTGFDADESELPKGYYHSPFFLGSFLAIGFSLWAGTAAL